MPKNFHSAYDCPKSVRKVIFTVAEVIQGDTKKRELLKNQTNIEEIQEKKFIDRN